MSCYRCPGTGMQVNRRKSFRQQRHSRHQQATHSASRRATQPRFELSRAGQSCTARWRRGRRPAGWQYSSSAADGGKTAASTALQDELAVNQYFVVMHPYLFIHALLTEVEAPPASASFVSRNFFLPSYGMQLVLCERYLQDRMCPEHVTRDPHCMLASNACQRHCLACMYSYMDRSPVPSTHALILCSPHTGTCPHLFAADPLSMRS